MAVSQSPTSINLIWTQPEGEIVDNYTVSFSYQGPCSGFNHTNTTTVAGTTRQYTLTGLQEFSNYTVTVVAVNGTGRSGGSSENVVTMSNGMSIQSITLKYQHPCIEWFFFTKLLFSSSYLLGSFVYAPIVALWPCLNIYHSRVFVKGKMWEPDTNNIL